MVDRTSPLHGRDGLRERRDHPVTRNLSRLVEQHNLQGAVLITFQGGDVSVTSSAMNNRWLGAMEKLGDMILAKIDDGDFDAATEV